MKVAVSVLLCAALFGTAARSSADPTTKPAAEADAAAAIAAAVGGGATADLSTDDAKACDAVVEEMVKAGFPDATGATVYSGPVRVSATFDPSKTAPQLPSERSGMQETHPNSNEVTYGYQLDGMHVKLADGSWILSARYHFTPGKADTVDVSDATTVDAKTVTADAATAKPGFDAATKAAKFLAAVPAADRPRAEAVMNRYVPVTAYLHLSPDDFGPAVVLLAKAGWADATGMSQVVAQMRSRSYWQLRPWTTPEAVFDPTGKNDWAKEAEKGWDADHVEFPLEAPPEALRRAMYRWCRAQVTEADPEDGMVPPAVGAACAKAAVDPGDRQQNGPRIDALLDGSKVPVTPADDADLAGKLASWEGRQRMPKMTVTGGGGAIGTSFDAPKPAYDPKRADLDALVALLADERPSRFNDFAGPHTVGDNAWRAVATLVAADPRKLAGYPVDHPWTADERKAAAAAVQAWWKDHRKAYADN